MRTFLVKDPDQRARERVAEEKRTEEEGKAGRGRKGGGNSHPSTWKVSRERKREVQDSGQLANKSSENAERASTL